MKERSQTVDAVKGVAAILVMIGHCIVLNHMEDGLVYDMIKSVQMPLFMIVSGYLVLYAKEVNTWSGLISQIKKRAAVCLVPFFVWTILLHPFTIMESLGTVMFQLDKGLWFLMVLFLLSTIMNLAKFRSNPILFGGVWLLFCVLLLLQIQMGNTFLSPHLSLYYAPFYLGGYLGGVAMQYFGFAKTKTDKTKTDKTKTDKAGIGSVLAVVILFALFFYLNFRFDMIKATNKAELIMQILSAITGSLAILLAVQKIKGKSKQLLSLIGRYTLEIYVIHYHFATLLWRNTEPVTTLGALWISRVFLSWALMTLLTVPVIVLFKRNKLTDTLLFGQLNRYLKNKH